MDTEPTGERVTVPLAEEHVTVHKTARVTSGVRVRKTVEETLQDIDETVNTQDVTVERVVIGRWVDQAPPQRQDGDTTIIPIVEEVAVIETRLRLVEEIRVTRTSATRRLRTAVPVRRERAVLEDVTDTKTNAKSTDHGATGPRAAAPTPLSRSTAMTIIIGLFTDPKAAEKARKAILDTSGKAATLQIYGAGAGASAADLRHSLSGLGIDRADIDALAGALDRKALILTASVPGDQGNAVIEAMTTHGASGTDRYDGPEDEAVETLQEAEETMGVAKRATTTGVRARATVTERPVQQTVTLRDETVEAHRRDADRELSGEEAEAAFQERTVEVTGVSEEAEIRKAARLIGEVEITKSAQERKETLRDTVRKTEVETERLDSDRTPPRGPSRR